MCKSWGHSQARRPNSCLIALRVYADIIYFLEIFYLQNLAHIN
jgi:hypothetical protein